MSSPPGTTRLLDLLIVAAGALAVLAWLEDGLQIPLGFTTLALRGPLRPALVLLVLSTLRLILAHRLPTRSTLSPALPRLPLASLTVAAVAYGLVHLTTVAGGADSYGYVSAAALIRQGTLSQPIPEAAWIPAANAPAVLTPLGYVPRPGNDSIVPLYPLGFPALIAGVSLILPVGLAPFVVAPVMAALMLALIYRIARRWTGDAATAWLAVCLAAWDPLVVTYAKQPMSDIPAAAWLLLAIWGLVRPTPWPLLGGMAAGASFVTRPGGVGAVAAVGLLALVQSPRPIQATLRFAMGLVPWVVLQAGLQWHLFGSPWRTGYGTLGDLYAGATLAENAVIYSRAFVSAHTLVWVPLVIAGLLALRRNGTAAWIMVLLATSLAPYLLYFEFDHWETLRFVLPAVVLLDVAAAAGAALILRQIPVVGARSIGMVAIAALAMIEARTFLEKEGVPHLMEQERRYVLTAEWIDQHTPAGTLVFAGQHSGAIRLYAGRTTLRWDVVAPGDLAAVVIEARRRGHPVYTALDREEHAQFRDRFAGALQPNAGGLTLLPSAQIRDVQIWEIASAAGAQ